LAYLYVVPPCAQALVRIYRIKVSAGLGLSFVATHKLILLRALVNCLITSHVGGINFVTLLVINLAKLESGISFEVHCHLYISETMLGLVDVFSNCLGLII